MRNIVLYIILVFSTIQCYSQKPDVEGRCLNPEFEKTVISYLAFSVPTKTISEIEDSILNYTIMDAREIDEYNVSHIPGAIYVGYDDFDIKNFQEMDKDKPVIVYCSIGYRSEKIGQKLSENGFTEVYNLFGSIFEWANQGNLLHDEKGKITNSIHTYNKKWSKWVDNPDLTKKH